MKNPRFSKKEVAQFCDKVIENYQYANGFDREDGTHQFLKLFDDSLIKSIKSNQKPLIANTMTEDDWNTKRDAERELYDLISKIVDYGITKGMYIILNEYDLKKEL
jgi:hypothetical protein